jgi:hypothetical protein
MSPVMSSDCTAGAFELGGGCFTGSLTRGGRLLGDEKRMPRRGSFDFSSPFCDGVPGSSGSSCPPGSSVSLSFLPRGPFLASTAPCLLRFGDALRGDVEERRFG